MFTPGILTRSQADTLNAMKNRVDGASFQQPGPIGQVQSAFGHQSQISPPRRRWWARITGASGGGYSWIEIAETAGGTWADVVPEWSGIANGYPLPHADGTVYSVPAGARVEMWVSPTIPNAFEFICGTEVDVVTNVECVAGSLVVTKTGMLVTYTA